MIEVNVALRRLRAGLQPGARSERNPLRVGARVADAVRYVDNQQQAVQARLDKIPSDKAECVARALDLGTGASGAGGERSQGRTRIAEGTCGAWCAHGLAGRGGPAATATEWSGLALLALRCNATQALLDGGSSDGPAVTARHHGLRRAPQNIVSSDACAMSRYVAAPASPR